MPLRYTKIPCDSIDAAIARARTAGATPGVDIDEIPIVSRLIHEDGELTVAEFELNRDFGYYGFLRFIRAGRQVRDQGDLGPATLAEGRRLAEVTIGQETSTPTYTPGPGAEVTENTPEATRIRELLAEGYLDEARELFSRTDHTEAGFLEFALAGAVADEELRRFPGPKQDLVRALLIGGRRLDEELLAAIREVMSDEELIDALPGTPGLRYATRDAFRALRPALSDGKTAERAEWLREVTPLGFPSENLYSLLPPTDDTVAVADAIVEKLGEPLDFSESFLQLIHSAAGDLKGRTLENLPLYRIPLEYIDALCQARVTWRNCTLRVGGVAPLSMVEFDWNKWRRRGPGNHDLAALMNHPQLGGAALRSLQKELQSRSSRDLERATAARLDLLAAQTTALQDDPRALAKHHLKKLMAHEHQLYADLNPEAFAAMFTYTAPVGADDAAKKLEQTFAEIRATYL